MNNVILVPQNPLEQIVIHHLTMSSMNFAAVKMSEQHMSGADWREVG